MFLRHLSVMALTTKNYQCHGHDGFIYIATHQVYELFFTSEILMLAQGLLYKCRVCVGVKNRIFLTSPCVSRKKSPSAGWAFFLPRIIYHKNLKSLVEKRAHHSHAEHRD